MATSAASGGEWLPALDVEGPGPQSRVTVLLRAILVIPQLVVLAVLDIAAAAVLVVCWFAALARGRPPAWAAEFLTGYLAWTTRVRVYAALMVGAYPPFRWTPADHPVRIEVRPGPLNRLAVLFRIVLAIPALVAVNVVATGWAIASPVIWVTVLVRGRMPQAGFDATAAVERYAMRTQAYLMLLASAYPKGLLGDGSDGPRLSPTRPLVLAGTARTLMWLFAALGAAGIVLQITLRNFG